jgi:predicted Zn-dependent protease
MSSAMIASLEKMLGGARDGALLRFSLGNEYLKAGNAEAAALHLQQAVLRDPAYSAAWKLLGKALVDSGALQEALTAYEQGIAVARSKGDKQAAKEMAVFAKRIERQLAPHPAPGEPPLGSQ